MKSITIPIGDEYITGTLHYPQSLKQKSPGVLFVHGWTSNEIGYHPRAQALTQLGAICLTINLRGHGTSSGSLEMFSRKQHREDIVAALDYLAGQSTVDPQQIGIVGASYGGYLAATTISKRTIKWLVLRAPAFYRNDGFDQPTAQLIGENEFEFFRQVNPDEKNYALTGIQKFTGDLLLVESEHDKIIPHEILAIYKNAAKNAVSVTHEVIKNADHRLSTEEDKNKFIHILTHWFSSKLTTQ